MVGYTEEEGRTGSLAGAPSFGSGVGAPEGGRGDGYVFPPIVPAAAPVGAISINPSLRPTRPIVDRQIIDRHFQTCYIHKRESVTLPVEQFASMSQ